MQLGENDSPYLYEPFDVYQRKPSFKKEAKMKPWHGVLFFVILMAVFYIAGTPLVLFGGMYGNAAAEILVFLGGSILIVCAMNQKLRDVFVLRKPNTPAVLGTLVMWYMAYQGITALFLVIGWLFPRQYLDLSNSMSDSMYGLSPIAELLVVALTPAICEEALHRGLLQYSLRDLKNKWLIVFLMGIYFGIFHMSLVRFLPMMLLGMVLSFIRQKTDNMFYPCMFHFIHNAWSVLADCLSDFLYRFPVAAPSYETVGGAVLPSTVGVCLIEAAIVPFGLYIGSSLLDYGNSGGMRQLFHWKTKKRALILLTLLTIGLLTAGILLTVYGLF
ncbi:MAG: type II CAAX endopeptidase family protein [Fusicatenibacter sp.]|nr:type II CAAX endopeptidase family protein [Lachnospiraceae bacterium]MDY2938574.1 type II CAAX endopeptidase family protein [Fusicatenibacter sp.]